MWNNRTWMLKTTLLLLAFIIYVTFLPKEVQTALGTFAVGWMLVDIINLLIKEQYMWDKIRTWAYINSVQITWFLIGLFTAFGLDSLAAGNLINALVNFGFAGLNYGLRKI